MPEKGTPSPAMTERNQAIYQKWKEGQSKLSLSREYELSYTRIWQIVNHQSKLDI